jgi:type IV pilus assembly protein PilW
MPHSATHTATSKAKGFSLVELLVAMAAAAVLLVAVYTIFTFNNEVRVVQGKFVQLQQGIRTTLGMMGQDLRLAGCNPTEEASNTGFVGANATSFRVRMDFHNGSGPSFPADGECTAAYEDIRYRFDDGSMRVDTGNGTHTLVDHVESFNATYTLADNSTTPNPSASELDDIRLVTLTMCGDLWGAYSDEWDQSPCYRQEVRCRNMR